MRKRPDNWLPKDMKYRPIRHSKGKAWIYPLFGYVDWKSRKVFSLAEDGFSKGSIELTNISAEEVIKAYGTSLDMGEEFLTGRFPINFPLWECRIDPTKDSLL